MKFIVNWRRAALVSIIALTTACATTLGTGDAPPPRLDQRIAAPSFSFGADTFTFPNLIGARHPDEPDIYAHYCFVLARGLRQFAQFARFDPALPKLDRAGYVERVQRVADRSVWKPALSPDDRVVIPGYANLREFSRAEELAVKEGLGGRFWTWVHWTNWRVMFPVTRSHQEAVAREIIDDLRAGRLVQLLVTNWPKPELNHTVVVFESRSAENGIEFVVWDPNNPSEPGVMTFDHGARRFWATDLYDTEPGPIRAFRMYYSPLL
ncbi:MAG: hypothetical protein DME04_18480 [Candidatus Rokuibacteriota bacterium]|nr:MAG: hypothetical protein DME04_18480 [Candidatus Rokubacteria bacterium]